MSETPENVTFDPERQAKAKEYARISRRLMLLDLVLGGVYLLAWLISGLYLQIRGVVLDITTVPALGILLYALFFGVPYSIVDIPLSYYTGFVLPHRYGQSNQTLNSWITDQLKGLAISGVLGTLLLEVVYWLLRAAPQWWWLYAGGVMLLFTVVMSILAPVIIAPLFYKFTPLEDEDLSQRLIALAEQAGTKVKGVFRFDMSTRTKSANAALMGLGSTRRIVLGDTLLDEFEADEIEVVLAHELGHHVHHDILLMISSNIVLTLLGFYLAHVALTWGVSQFGLQSIADPAGLPLLGLATGILGLITMPPGNAFSRWRERLVDHYALESTGKRQAFIDAMTRLANQNLADADPERWVVWLLYSHPPIRDRIVFAEQFDSSA